MVDRDTKALLLLLVIGLWGLLLRPFIEPTPAQAKGAAPAVRWSYFITQGGGTPVEEMNTLGAQGWEAVAVNFSGQVLFKRRR